MFTSDVLQTARAKLTFKSSYSRHSSINLAELRRLCCIVLYCTIVPSTRTVVQKNYESMNDIFEDENVHNVLLAITKKLKIQIW